VFSMKCYNLIKGYSLWQQKNLLSPILSLFFDLTFPGKTYTKK